jgi:hypothetical protein
VEEKTEESSPQIVTQEEPQPMPAAEPSKAVDSEVKELEDEDKEFHGIKDHETVQEVSAGAPNDPIDAEPSSDSSPSEVQTPAVSTATATTEASAS